MSGLLNVYNLLLSSLPTAVFSPPSVSVSLKDERLVVKVQYPCAVSRRCSLDQCCPISELIDPWTTVTVCSPGEPDCQVCLLSHLFILAFPKDPRVNSSFKSTRNKHQVWIVSDLKDRCVIYFEKPHC